MHGVEGAWHCFMNLGDASYSFVFVPDNAKRNAVIGETHAGNGEAAYRAMLTAPDEAIAAAASVLELPHPRTQTHGQRTIDSAIAARRGV